MNIKDINSSYQEIEFVSGIPWTDDSIYVGILSLIVVISISLLCWWVHTRYTGGGPKAF